MLCHHDRSLLYASLNYIPLSTSLMLLGLTQPLHDHRIIQLYYTAPLLGLIFSIYVVITIFPNVITCCCIKAKAYHINVGIII